MSAGTGWELILNAAEGILQLCITEDEVLRCAQAWSCPDHATEILAPALDSMCRSLGVQPAQFRRIACVRGPGSFTGIRLVLTTAAALRRTGHAQLAALDALQALATTVTQRHCLPFGTKVWTLTQARRNLLHCQCFQSYGPRIPAQPLAAVELCAPQEALRRLMVSRSEGCGEVSCAARVWVCGSGLRRHEAVFGSLDGMGELPLSADALVVALPDVTVPDATALCLLARHGDYFPKDIEPLYVRPCDAVEHLPELAQELGMDGEEAKAALEARLTRTPQSDT